MANFHLNKELLGKPIFEIYHYDTKKIYKRIIAASDTIKVGFNFTIWGKPWVGENLLRTNIDYYIQKKQADSMFYYGFK